MEYSLNNPPFRSDNASLFFGLYTIVILFGPFPLLLEHTLI